MDLNGAIFEAINGLAGHVWAVDKTMEYAAQYAVYVIVTVVAASWFAHSAPGDRRRLAVYTAVAAGVAAILIAKGIQHVYVHQRPFVLRSDVTQLIEHSADASFPSEHTSGAFGLATGMAVYRWRIGAGLLALACLVAFARVFVGVHYPADVVAGGAIGALIALVLTWCRPAFDWLDRRLVLRVVPAALR